MNLLWIRASHYALVLECEYHTVSELEKRNNSDTKWKKAWPTRRMARKRYTGNSLSYRCGMRKRGATDRGSQKRARAIIQRQHAGMKNYDGEHHSSIPSYKRLTFTNPHALHRYCSSFRHKRTGTFEYETQIPVRTDNLPYRLLIFVFRFITTTITVPYHIISHPSQTWKKRRKKTAPNRELRNGTDRISTRSTRARPSSKIRGRMDHMSSKQKKGRGGERRKKEKEKENKRKGTIGKAGVGKGHKKMH